MKQGALLRQTRAFKALQLRFNGFFNRLTAAGVVLVLHPSVQPIEYKRTNGAGDFEFVHCVTFDHTVIEVYVGWLLRNA